MVWLVALACTGASESSDSLEETVAADGSEMARLIGDVSAAGAQVPDEAADATLQQCFDTWDGCSLCYDLTGGPLGGTYVAALDGAPCSAERVGRVGTQTYTVASFDLDGTWDGTTVTPACDGLGTSYAIKLWWLDDRRSGLATTDVAAEPTTRPASFTAPATLDCA